MSGTIHAWYARHRRSIDDEDGVSRHKTTSRAQVVAQTTSRIQQLPAWEMGQGALENTSSRWIEGGWLAGYLAISLSACNDKRLSANRRTADCQNGKSKKRRGIPGARKSLPRGPPLRAGTFGSRGRALGFREPVFPQLSRQAREATGHTRSE